jgi:hypothetical protein
MHAPEIATARYLTDVLFDWLSQRHSLPVIDQPISNARIGLRAEGGPELVDIVEKFGDPEVLSRAQIGAVYMQGDPRRPDVRWLPDLKGIVKILTLGELQHFEKSLAEGQSEKIRGLVVRIVGVFKNQVDLRRAALTKRYTELFGTGSTLVINGEPVTDKMIDERPFGELVMRLEFEAEKGVPGDKIRSWRGQ